MLTASTSCHPLSWLFWARAVTCGSVMPVLLVASATVYSAGSAGPLYAWSAVASTSRSR